MATSPSLPRDPVSTRRRNAPSPTKRIPAFQTAGYEVKGFSTAIDEMMAQLYFEGTITHRAYKSFTADHGEPNTVQTLVNVLPELEVVRYIFPFHAHSPAKALLRSRVASDPLWIVADIGPDHLRLEVGGVTMKRVADATQLFVDQLSTPTKKPATVSYDIYTSSDRFSNSRSIDKVMFEEVEKNYAPATREGLDALRGYNEKDFAGHSGRIILLHGRPGTGKTWALRMLLSEWSTWTDAAVIADPENFLDNPDYLMSVLDSARDGSVRLLIIEDADALVERRSGRPGSVARLLNMTDGLLGASQDNFIIFTTNSPPNELDAALTRPGRCLATVYFEPFSVKDANQFLDGPRVTTPQTLAELYRARGDISQINVSGGELATGQYL